MVCMAREAGIEAAVLRLIARRKDVLASVARQIGVTLRPDSEKDRLIAIRAAAQAPERCGPEIPLAPARGPMIAVAPRGMRATADGYELQHVGFQGRDAARASDVFDRMSQQARRRGGGDPLTASQVDVARLYAALVERHSSVGFKCVSVEAMSRGGKGSDGGGYIDAVLAEGELIGRMEAAIGDGMALEVKRATDTQRRRITTCNLVTLVCLSGRTVTEVLRANGWSVYGGVRDQAYAALGAALDRMGVVAPSTR